jgi:hypothetical protein
VCHGISRLNVGSRFKKKKVKNPHEQIYAFNLFTCLCFTYIYDSVMDLLNGLLSETP